MAEVLVIDDDRAISLLVKDSLNGIATVTQAMGGHVGMQMLEERSFDAVLLDIILPDVNGLELFAAIHEQDSRLPVIFMTVDVNSDTAIEAMQMGAFDYLAKPLQVDSLRTLVAKAIEQRELSSVPVAIAASEDDADTRRSLFIGRSDAMLDVFKSIGKVSSQQVPVLIRGESGTGKELVARAIYQHSDRSKELFLAVNCAALNESLLESELFGHEKGAFTGAETRHIGKLEQCQGGTLFLDEIGDMPLSVQAKVLRVLQGQPFQRVGGSNELSTDVRIIAATNRPLDKMVAEGDFREDLLYRLNAFTIRIPPLRQRQDDIPLLIQHFMGQAKREFGKPELEGISADTVAIFENYDWPGNVRQLRAVIRRCVLDCVFPVIGTDVLPAELQSGSETTVQTGSTDTDGRGLPDMVDRLVAQRSTQLYADTISYAERYLLVRVLRIVGGNQSKAAEMLGITRGKLRDRIATYNINLQRGVEIGER